MGKIRKGHIHTPGTDQHYRWLVVEHGFKKVFPVKLGGRGGMYGQIVTTASTSKEMTKHKVIKNSDGLPIPYSQIGISAVERWSLEPVTE